MSLSETESMHHDFRIRTITAFITLECGDFMEDSSTTVDDKISACSHVLSQVSQALERCGYEIQTTRIATNPFAKWISDSPDSLVIEAERRLQILDECLAKYGIEFCSLGPSNSSNETRTYCSRIVAASHRFSCSANVGPVDVDAARAVAECIIENSKAGSSEEAHDNNGTDICTTPPHLAGGIGNFRFCAAANCRPFIPFFPGAKSDKHVLGNKIGFAIGLENGVLAKKLLTKCKSISQIGTVFKNGIVKALTAVERICKQITDDEQCVYLGIDTSLNPSLDEEGSVAAALESLTEVECFGGNGSLAAAAALTMTLQSLPLQTVGYCGLMLPVCEDRRLAELASQIPSKLSVSQLLNLSSACGVGVDTVPVPGTCSTDDLTYLILDVAGLAAKWNKSLSCRVFPVPGLLAGDFTSFNSPFLCNSRVFSLD